MSINHFRRGLVPASILCFLVAPLVTSVAYAADVTVFAAASLKNALDDVTKLYEAKTGNKVAISYAASPGLAKQIEAGAPADIFFSADLNWMDYLAQKDLINNASRQTLLGDTLVLVAPKDSVVVLTIGKDFPPPRSPSGPTASWRWPSVDSVPAGKYGKAALTSLGVWDAVSPRVAQAENVRAALALVARGEVPLGIVYGTDAKSEPAVKVVGRLSRRKPPQNPVSRGVAHVGEARGSQIPRLSRLLPRRSRSSRPRGSPFGQAKLEEPKVKKISA